jgi:DNA-binding transcriptional MerR regulator
MNTRTLRIGHLASRIGVHPEAIRYYERRGLLPRPQRGPNGYRIYTPQHLERVEFIKKVQEMGFSLEEIREVMELKFGGASPCQHVRDLLQQKVQEADRQIAHLRAYRRGLTESLKDCEKSLKYHSASKDRCPALERIQTKTTRG